MQLWMAVNQYSPICFETTEAFTSEEALKKYLDSQISKEWLQDSKIIKFEVGE